MGCAERLIYFTEDDDRGSRQHDRSDSATRNLVKEDRQRLVHDHVAQQQRAEDPVPTPAQELEHLARVLLDVRLAGRLEHFEVCHVEGEEREGQAGEQPAGEDEEAAEPELDPKLWKRGRRRLGEEGLQSGWPSGFVGDAGESQARWDQVGVSAVQRCSSGSSYLLNQVQLLADPRLLPTL